MIRATTPTHILTFPFDVLNECKKVLITYNQNGKTVIEKHKEDLEPIEGEEYKYSYRLSQEETKLFNASSSVEFQVRVLTYLDEAMASKISNISVQRVLDDQVL